MRRKFYNQYKDEDGTFRTAELEMIDVEGENGKRHKGLVFEGQHVDDDGFINTVKYVEVPVPLESKEGETFYIKGYTKRVIIDDDIKKIVVKKNASVELWHSD